MVFRLFSTLVTSQRLFRIPSLSSVYLSRANAEIKIESVSKKNISSEEPVRHDLLWDFITMSCRPDSEWDLIVLLYLDDSITVTLPVLLIIKSATYYEKNVFFFFFEVIIGINLNCPLSCA